MWPWGNARIRVCLDGMAKKKGKKKPKQAPFLPKLQSAHFDGGEEAKSK